MLDRQAQLVLRVRLVLKDLQEHPDQMEPLGQLDRLVPPERLVLPPT